jgi:hypothetical protein
MEVGRYSWCVVEIGETALNHAMPQRSAPCRIQRGWSTDVRSLRGLANLIVMNSLRRTPGAANPLSAILRWRRRLNSKAIMHVTGAQSSKWAGASLLLANPMSCSSTLFAHMLSRCETCQLRTSLVQSYNNDWQQTLALVCRFALCHQQCNPFEGQGSYGIYDGWE